MAGMWGPLCRVLQRRRVFEPDQLDQGNLRRCLTVWDLTALGVGSSLGVGVYVLIGAVALNLAGPAIVLSFLIAAAAAVVAGMCYAEFGARVPKAGSAYIYTYVTVGEFVAFIIGWDNILEAVFGTASVARGLSMYVDSMTNSSMSSWFATALPISSPHLSPHFDVFAFLVVMFLGVLLAFGVRESTMVNNLFTAINMLVIIFIILAGAFKADVSNWSIPEADVPENHGVGGFFPYGVWGMLKGAAVCFYGFVGFDAISSTGEEVRDPRRAIPISILSTQGIVFLAYAGASTVVTMMMPYYLQEKVASVATAFAYVGWEWARWFVTVGAVLGIVASLYGSMFPLPRLLYAMATDGLLFRWLARVTTSRQSPCVATLLSAVIIAILAAILELNELILMMCVGTLFSYSIVACCVIILRYRTDAPPTSSGFAKQMFGLGQRAPTRNTSCIIYISLVLFVCTCFATALVAHHAADPLVYVCVLHALALALVVIMTLQPQLKEELSFKTPLVPLVPCLSVYVNINLMVMIKVETWIRVFIWIAIGIPVYIFCVCCYKQNNEQDLEGSLNFSTKSNVNGKPPVQIYVVSPTPPDTVKHSDHLEQIKYHDDKMEEIGPQEEIIKEQASYITEEILVQHAFVEDNEEKEAKIIDLLDQVLQAEEDSYGEIISLKENKEDDAVQGNIPHRKSLSELSDAGSEASVGNPVLSKYDVIAQVHREDLPKLKEEEEEKSDKEEFDFKENYDMNGDEEVTAFNDSDSNSRTDESGYSDTIDKTALNESIEDLKEEIPYIPTPPPLDESYFATPGFKKSYTISARPKTKIIEPEEDIKPRESIKSNNSFDDTPMVFGSDKQMNFMSKLENIFQTKMATGHEDEPRIRSNSIGNVVENTDNTKLPDRPSLLLDLKKEITSGDAVHNLRHIDIEENKTSSIETEEEETSLSREDLKSKLETIYATGGPKVLTKKLMKSNPPTPEEAYQTDTSSTESIAKPKVEKNDTLKRQKTKFGEVLNSLRMTLNKEDDV